MTLQSETYFVCALQLLLEVLGSLNPHEVILDGWVAVTVTVVYGLA